MVKKFLDINGLTYVVKNIKGAISVKVDKEPGKHLSTNDYTTAEKTKLSGLSNYTHPTTSGSKHIPTGGTSGQFLRWSADGTAEWGADNNTTYSNMKGATSSAAGTSGLVPAPEAGKQEKFLCGNGTWQSPVGTTYGKATSILDGLMAKEDKIKIDEIASGAQVNVIETVKVNNAPVSISNKAVNIDLTNYATKADVSSVYKVKGSKGSEALLPTTGNIPGDVWNVNDTGANYVWTGSAWDKLSETVDLSGYLQKSEVTEITNAEIDAIMAI